MSASDHLPANGASAVPGPGQAPLPAANAAALIIRNGTDDAFAGRPAIHFGDRSWTHSDVLVESRRWAALFESARPIGGRPPHIGILSDNTPEYLFALSGAALCGATIVGLNHTRVGEHLARDIAHTDVDLVITEPNHLESLSGIDGVRVLVNHRHDARSSGVGPGDDLDVALDSVAAWTGGHPVSADERWALIFTSGTSGAPKAVVCSQRRLLVTGNRMAMMMELGPDDVGYICMPLFHSNALMVGWAPSIVVGASVGLARKFSSSGWLRDVRRYGSTWFNYTGKPLSYLVATPELVDDSDNSVRVAFGNEGSPQVVSEFSRRFAVRVIDAFGSTEGAIAVSRDGPARAGAMGVAGPSIGVVNDDGEMCVPARFDESGRLVNADECVGEIVNTAGAGPFEGYYNNVDATASATRRGWYWSGDLGYLDTDRYLYFAGRTAEWIRVNGENFPAGPILDAIVSHPGVIVGSVYGVPDVHAGDQAMAAVVLAADVRFDGAEFARWIDSLPGIGPTWRPRYIRVAQELPTTGTNKIVTRTLVHQKFRRDRVGDDELWVRERGDDAYRRFTADDERVLEALFIAAGRERFWEL